MEKLVKLAALGALGAAAGFGVLYLALGFLLRPTVTGGAVGATGGFDAMGWHVALIAMLVPVLVFIGVHVAFARQLQTGPRPMH